MVIKTLNMVTLSLRVLVQCTFFLSTIGYIYVVICYCEIFSSLSLQKDINETITVWNTHCIRPTKNQNVPSGRPCIMYTMPVVYGVQDYSVEVDADAVSVCKDECLLNQDRPSDSDFNELFNILVEENNIEMNMEPEQALDNYKILRQIVLQELHQ